MKAAKWILDSDSDISDDDSDIRDRISGSDRDRDSVWSVSAAQAVRLLNIFSSRIGWSCIVKSHAKMYIEAWSDPSLGNAAILFN